MLEKIQKLQEILGLTSGKDIPDYLKGLNGSINALKTSLEAYGKETAAQEKEGVNENLEPAKNDVLGKIKAFEKSCSGVLAADNLQLGDDQTLSLIDMVFDANAEKEKIENGKVNVSVNPEAEKMADFLFGEDENGVPKVSDDERKIRQKAAKEYFKRDRLAHPEYYSDYKRGMNRLDKLAEALKEADRIIKEEQAENESLKNKSKELADTVNKAICKAAVEKRFSDPVKSSEAEILKEFAVKSLDAGAVKTLTDLYKGNDKSEIDIKTLFEAGLIRDKKGNPYDISTKPEAAIDKFLSDVRNGEPVYAEGPNGDKSYMIHKSSDRTDKKNIKETVAATQQRDKLVKPSVKRKTISVLNEVLKEFRKLDKKGVSEEFRNLQSACEDTLEKIEKAAFKGTFDKALKDFGEACDQYTYAATGKKPSKQIANAINIAHVGRDIVDQALDQKEPEIDRLQAARRTVATKCIRAFAESAKNSDDKSVKNRADAILNDPKRMDIEIKNCLKTPAFVAMFGSKDSPAGLEALSAAIQKTGKEIFTDVKEKQKQMTKDEHRKIVSENYKKNIADKRPVSDPQREDLKNQIARLDAELKSVYGGSSAEYEQFRKELSITNIRLQNGSPYMNIRKQMAGLARAANNYFDKKVEGSMGRYETTRTSVAGRIMQICKNLEEDRMPSENVPQTKDQLDKQNAAAKLVHATANKMRSTGAPDLMAQANKILTDPVEFARKTEEMQKQEAFRNLTADGGRSLLAADSEKALGKLAKEAKRIEAEKKAAQKQKEAEKEKQKNKDDVKKEDIKKETEAPKKEKNKEAGGLALG